MTTMQKRTGLAVAGSTLALGRPGAPAIGADPASWGGALKTIADCGFEHVDLVSAWVSPGVLSAAELDELGEALDDAGLRPAGVSLVRASVIDPADGPANLDLTLATLEATAHLGAPVLSIGFHRPLQGAQLHGPFWMAAAPTDDASDANFDRAIERLAQVCASAERLDVDVSLELHEGTLLDRGERIMRLLDGVGSERLGVNLDIGNLIRVPGPMVEPWRETLQACLGRINYWHIKNYMRLEQPSTGLALSVPCGIADGEIDYRTAAEQVIGAGYRGALCIEHYGGDPLWVMRQGREYLQSLPSVNGADRS
jgi:sugar phosphate isomerase/epimerase